jgi:deoxyribodipyrimidine photolyase-related protein
MQTVWILGDQLHRDVSSLSAATPKTSRVLFVVSTSFLGSRSWHRQRVHVVLAGMRRFALSLEQEGFDVDWRIANSMGEGVQAHCEQFGSRSVRVMEPADVRLRGAIGKIDRSEVTPNDQFLCSSSQFAQWAGTRKSRLRMEDFYRFQRVRLDVLMDGSEPVGGQWNLDHENRERPPKDGRAWPAPSLYPLDEVDKEISALIDKYVPKVTGAAWNGLWPTSSAQAQQRLNKVLAEVLPKFGPHEDAMLSSSWHLAHTALSSSINLGMLRPHDVVHAAEQAYRNGHVPLASAEGFIRQIIGWREYVYGLAHYWGASYADHNQLNATMPIPPAFRDANATRMVCVSQAVAGVEQRAYAHHIQRLMVLGNLALLAGVNPQAMTAWMRESFIDSADWVMAPNVVGMSLHADGGMMATKPYASGGAYINKMSDSCKGCAYDPKLRTGAKACPFTTLYWDFLARHEDRFRSNHRMSQPLAGLRRLSDLPAVQERAAEVKQMLAAGTL